MPGTKTKEVAIEVDGVPVRAEAGICVAAALLRAGIRQLRQSPLGNPRGAFCLMGVCQECLLLIDGKSAQACLTSVSDGMIITTRQAE